MVDTVRTLAALQALLADNDTEQISPQDVRDFLVSAYTGPVLLETQTLGADAASVTFSNIPSAYDILRFEIDAITSARSAVYDTLQIRVGATSVDTGSNYKWAVSRQNNLDADNANASFIRVGDNGAGVNWVPAANAAAGSEGSCVIDIYDYTSTGQRLVLARAFGYNGTSGAAAVYCHGMYVGSQAIDIVTFTLEGGANILTDSRFRMYGVRKPELP